MATGNKGQQVIISKLISFFPHMCPIYFNWLHSFSSLISQPNLAVALWPHFLKMKWKQYETVRVTNWKFISIKMLNNFVQSPFGADGGRFRL